MFSRLLFLQSKWNLLTLGELKDARDLSSIVLRACVGMTGAVVVYFFLQSGMVSGALFPDLGSISLFTPAADLISAYQNTGKGAAQTGSQSPRSPTLPAGSQVAPELALNSEHFEFPNIALALLVVWCFLAGFSERLVPSILNKTEVSLDTAVK
jgi:hypothetical protein